MCNCACVCEREKKATGQLCVVIFRRQNCDVVGFVLCVCAREGGRERESERERSPLTDHRSHKSVSTEAMRLQACAFLPGV